MSVDVRTHFTWPAVKHNRKCSILVSSFSTSVTSNFSNCFRYFFHGAIHFVTGSAAYFCRIPIYISLRHDYVHLCICRTAQVLIVKGHRYINECDPCKYSCKRACKYMQHTYALYERNIWRQSYSAEFQHAVTIPFQTHLTYYNLT